MNTFILFFSVFMIAFCLEAKEAIRIHADTLLYDEAESKVQATGNVLLNWNDISISTDQLTYFFNTSEAFIPGSIQARFGNYQIKAEKMYYNFLTRNGWFESAELIYELSESGKLYFRGTKIEYQKGKWTGSDLLLTGCPRTPPLSSSRSSDLSSGSNSHQWSRILYSR